MKYFMPKGETVAWMMHDSKEFFKEYDIDVSGFTIGLYEEMYYAFLANTIESLSEWKSLPRLKAMGVICDVNEANRKPDINTQYYDIFDTANVVEKQLCRYLVQLENVYHNHDQTLKEMNLKEIMERWYSFVLDEIALDIKRQLHLIMGDNSWDIYDIVIRNRDVTLINYGDFRLISWKELFFKGD